MAPEFEVRRRRAAMFDARMALDGGSLVLLAVLSYAAMGQTPAAQTPVPSWRTSAGGKMSFEVASIRPSPPDDNFMYPPSGTAENFSARLATVESMIGFAYDIPTVIGMSVDPASFFLPHASNLIGGPAWVSSDKYDLTAKAYAETVDAWSKLPKKQQTEELRSMMRALLEERFHLTMRQETREMPVWALVVAKRGPKFAEAPMPPGDKDRWKLDRGLIQGRDVSINDFDEMLREQREIESRKILDHTGLKGKYDLTLKWASVDDPKEPEGPSLFTAIQEQSGLKLESTKAPMDVLVIDHVERPSKNYRVSYLPQYAFHKFGQPGHRQHRS